MNHIGNIIKIYRNILKMSRAKLSENICSEKYVYYIEKGVRTPSAYMVRLFGNKLGVDLFDHFQYLDCINPIEVRKIMKRIMLCRQRGDFNEVKEAMDIAIHLPDFRHKPWVYEIEINRLSYMIFVEHRYHAAMPALNDLIKNIDPKYLTDIYMTNIYILQSIACQLTGDLISAKRAISSAQDVIRNKENIERYAHIIISVKISSMTLHYLSGEFHKGIQEGNELLQYQKEINSYERVYYSYFYLAFAHYKTGACDEAIKWFKKGIYWVLINDRPMDVHYISSQDVFDVLLNNSHISPDMVREFKDKYNIS